MTTSNLAPNSPFGFTILGLTAFQPGLLLDGLQMPGCFQYINPFVTHGVVGGGSSTSTTFTLPNQLVFQGAQVHCQTLMLDPAANAMGAATSNAVTLNLGRL